MEVLVIAAHPDDEVLGCGGAVARHRLDGDHVYVIFMTNGEGSRKKKEVKARLKAQREAAEILGYKTIAIGSFYDNAMDATPLLEITQWLERETEKYNFDVVYTHYLHDLNIDHRITAQATLTAFRPKVGAPDILSFEIPSSTELSIGPRFSPNHYINVIDVYDKKLAALRAYGAEMRSIPHPRSHVGLIALSNIRGTEAGFFMAEAFMILRSLW